MADINFPLLIAALEEENRRLDYNRKKRNIRGTTDPLDLPENVFKTVYRVMHRQVEHRKSHVNFKGSQYLETLNFTWDFLCSTWRCITRYRFSKNTASYLIEEIGQFIPEAERQQRIPKAEIILSALHFYAQGTYQKSTGQDINCPMSQSSVSRCLDLVTNILNDHFGHKVHFPTTEDEKHQEKIKFVNNLDGFPGIIGVIDGTHIKIQAPPTEDEEFPGILFYNRKGFYSLNAQLICSADYKILAISARYPGSVHDSAVWSTSLPRMHLMENYFHGDRSSWLLGDSGYPLEPWLMTPVVGDNLNNRERSFNIEFKRIRNVVERVIGILKSRFRCCFGHRALHYSPIKAAKIINACAILHNILIERRDFIEEDMNEANEPDDPVDFNYLDLGRNYRNEGRNIRNRIIQDYF